MELWMVWKRRCCCENSWMVSNYGFSKVRL